MKFSIIIPVYNVEKYLPQCIDSVLAQTFTDYEIILVNDGSTDNSGKICDKYVEENACIKVFHKKNEGVSLARNLGIEKASGEYICFIDSDDWVDSNYLEEFDIYSNKDIHMQGYLVVKNENIVGGSNFSKNIYFSSFSDFLLYIEKNSLSNSPCMKAFRLETIKNYNIQFDPKFNIGEDHIFTLEYLYRCKTYYYSTFSGYYYRKENNHKSLTSKIINLDSFFRYIERTHNLRLDIIQSNKDTYRYIMSSLKEKNKWLYSLLVYLFDKKRNAPLKEKNYWIEVVIANSEKYIPNSKILLKDIFLKILFMIINSKILSTKIKCNLVRWQFKGLLKIKK